MHELNFTATREEAYLCEAIRHIDRIDPEVLRKGYAELGDAAIYTAATKNGVAGNVAHALRVHGVATTDLPSHWDEAFAENDARINAYMQELDRVADALHDKQIPLVALKNSGITRGLYRYPGASPMGDIDVLIRPGDFYQAHAVLEGLGYTLKFRSEYENADIDEAFAHGGAEYSTTLPDGQHLWFELQWRPIAGRWIQPEQEPKADDLMDRAMAIEGSRVLLLSPEDNLLQVSLHTAKHSYVRAPGFRLHTDVDRIVSGTTINWSIFIQRVKEMRVRTAVYMSLAMAKNLLGTDIPEHVLSAIAPPTWKIRLLERWLDSVSIFNPDDRKWSNGGFILFVVLLYDGVPSIWRAVFPTLQTMQHTYDGVNKINVPLFHLKRLASLMLQRTGI